MLNAITSGVTSVIGWVGDIITAIFGTSGSWADLAVVLGISIAIAIVGYAIRIIKSVTFGY